ANRHKIKLTAYNFFDLALPATYWQGQPTVNDRMFPADTPAPLVCNGTAGEPFYFPLRVDGLGHILGIGKSGGGQPTWAGLFVCAVQSVPNTRVMWLDPSQARASYVVAHLLNADYRDVGTEDTAPLCPLALLDKPNGLQWLMGWFERLFLRRKGFEI